MSMVEITDKERTLASRIDSAITTSLTVSDRAGGVSFSNASEVMEWAKTMAIANSGVRKHLRGNPGACLAICVQALEWGMSSFAVANKSYFVNDQIAFESQLIQAVILKRAPIKGRLKFDFSGEGQNRVCRAWARLRDEPDEIVEYVSPAFKDISPKNSPLWKTDPDQQHCYYSGRALCRRHFPDVLLGVYAEDEFSPEEAQGFSSAKVVSAPPRTTTERFDALAKQTSTLKTPIEHADLSADPQTPQDEFDPETGELFGATEDAPADPHDDLIGRLMSVALNDGPAPLRAALKALPSNEAKLLTGDDKRRLDDAAMAANQQAHS